MILKDIYEGSTYMTDEEMSNDQAVAAANQAIAEINTKADTSLPFYENQNYQEIEYDAFGADWQLRLIEPYISFAIATNDSDNNARDFHYNRFLSALSDFKNKGLIYEVVKEFEQKYPEEARGISNYKIMTPKKDKPKEHSK